MGNIWSFAAAAIIGGAIIYQRPLSNILINLAQKAGQQTSLPPTPTATDKAPFSGPTNDPNPSSPSPSPAPAPSPTTPLPTAAKGGTDRFSVTHFYPDSPTGVFISSLLKMMMLAPEPEIRRTPGNGPFPIAGIVN
jgi:hypothetical protein